MVVLLDKSARWKPCRWVTMLTEDEGKKNRFPAGEIAKNRLDTVRCTLRSPSSFRHSLFCDFDFLPAQVDAISKVSYCGRPTSSAYPF